MVDAQIGVVRNLLGVDEINLAVGIGIVHRLRIGEGVVDGSMRVDHHLRVGLYQQGAREIPDAVEGGDIAFGLIDQMSVGTIPVVGALTVVGRGEALVDIADADGLDVA